MPTRNEYTGSLTLSDPLVSSAEDLAAGDWEVIDREDFYELVYGEDAPPFQHPNPNVRRKELRIGPGVLKVGYWVPNLAGLRSMPFLGPLFQVFSGKPRDAERQE